MRLILVRHGESIGNFENRLQGHADFDLTELGERQAELTGQRLAAMSVSALYTSPLLRAASTAERISRSTGLEPVPLPEMSEYRFGELSGKTYADLRQHFANSEPGSSSPGERRYPGEEGRGAFYERVTGAASDLVQSHRGETVAVVSHGGPIALFCQTVLGLPYQRPMPFSISNCSITSAEAEGEVRSNNSDLVLLNLNDTCHLKAV